MKTVKEGLLLFQCLLLDDTNLTKKDLRSSYQFKNLQRQHMSQTISIVSIVLIMADIFKRKKQQEYLSPEINNFFSDMNCLKKRCVIRNNRPPSKHIRKKLNFVFATIRHVSQLKTIVQKNCVNFEPFWIDKKTFRRLWS